ncbi:MAG TPA: polysaccharide biosynthesis tyrosine autokinase [Vicinamibacterales bacterium]|nr:polysaccharide biosynthesis tyrosine autokinase [Vicinamibacterales bacterium]
MRAPSLPSETASAVPLPPVNSGQPIHVLDRLTAVFKHRRVAGTAFVLVVTAMMLQSYSTIPQYMTSARIEILNPRSVQISSTASQDQYFEDPEMYNATQVQILKSRDLARDVVRRLDLQNHPEFNGSKPRPRDPVSLIREARAGVSAWVRGLVARPSPSEPPPGTTRLKDETAAESALIGAFLAGVEVNQQRPTSLFVITYRHTNPDFAVLAANTLAEEYIRKNVEVRLADTTKRLEFIKTEIENAQRRVKQAEDAMTQYREEHNALSLQDKTNLVNDSLNSAQTALTRAEAERKQKELVYNQLSGLDPASDSADGIPAIANSRGVIEAKGALRALENQRGEMLARGMGENHPQLSKVMQDIATQRAVLIAERKKVIDAARSEYELARQTEASFANALARAKNESMDLSRKSGDYNILADKARTERETLNSLLQERNRLEVIANSRANNARFVDRAERPGAPFAPNSKKDLLTAILAGLTIALCLAFGIEYLDDSIKTPEDITRRLKLPLLGLVPAIKGDHVPILTEAVPHDFGEAFRSLRTSLVFTSGGEATRVIAVTSSQPLEGKTTTAANLAFALALGGSRVLLIDADMRRPGLHKTIGMQNAIGLSHILTGQTRVREAIQRTAEPNLFVITAGRTPPNPSELLASDRMAQLMTALAQGPFEWIIIDTPPVLAVTDAVVVAQKVAGVVFVVGSEMTRRVHAERALDTLQAGKVRSIGVVLNRVDFNRNKYYYSRYYGYQYKSYYGQSTVA